MDIMDNKKLLIIIGVIAIASSIAIVTYSELTTYKEYADEHIMVEIPKNMDFNIKKTDDGLIYSNEDLNITTFSLNNTADYIKQKRSILNKIDVQTVKNQTDNNGKTIYYIVLLDDATKSITFITSSDFSVITHVIETFSIVSPYITDLTENIENLTNSVNKNDFINNLNNYINKNIDHPVKPPGDEDPITPPGNNSTRPPRDNHRDNNTTGPPRDNHRDNRRDN